MNTTIIKTPNGWLDTYYKNTAYSTASDEVGGINKNGKNRSQYEVSVDCKNGKLHLPHTKSANDDEKGASGGSCYGNPLLYIHGKELGRLGFGWSWRWAEVKFGEVSSSKVWKSHWKKSNKGKVVKHYQSGKIDGTTHKTHIRKDSPYFVMFLTSYLGISLETALDVSAVMNSITHRIKAGVEFTDLHKNILELDPNKVRYMDGTTATYDRLPDYLQAMFFEEVRVKTHKKKSFTLGLIFKQGYDDELSGVMTEFVSHLTKQHTRENHLDTVSIYVEEFANMTLQYQSYILRNMLVVKNNMIIVRKNSKQEIGHYGRQYNVINEFARYDRAGIHLYGFDIEAALQNIIYYKLLNDELRNKCPLTFYYIQNKQSVREEIADLLKMEVPEVKTLLTAIFQGMKYKTKYGSIEYLFKEVELIRNYVMDNLFDDGSIEDEYATKRANEMMKQKVTESEHSDVKPYSNRRHRLSMYRVKSPKGKSRLSDEEKRIMANSYLFFRWTYWEREVQNIISKKFIKPHTLHDGVYTQDINEFLDVNNELDFLMVEIDFVLDIPIKLSVDITEAFYYHWTKNNNGVYVANSDCIFLESMAA